METTEEQKQDNERIIFKVAKTALGFTAVSYDAQEEHDAFTLVTALIALLRQDKELEELFYSMAMLEENDADMKKAFDKNIVTVPDFNELLKNKN